jgi:hypothetical protein
MTFMKTISGFTSIIARSVVRVFLSITNNMTTAQVIATSAASVAGIAFGDERNICSSSRVFAFVHATGFFLNSGQLRLSSSLKNAS